MAKLIDNNHVLCSGSGIHFGDTSAFRQGCHISLRHYPESFRYGVLCSNTKTVGEVFRDETIVRTLFHTCVEW